jgi:hypothetical protein
MKMETLYEQNPEAWDKIAASGFQSVREVAKMFHKPSQMNEALGYINGAEHWLSGRNKATNRAERAAKAWLASLNSPALAANPAANQSATFLCICDKATAAKVQKVLALMGCEFVEV